MRNGNWYEFERLFVYDMETLVECIAFSTQRNLYGYNVDFRGSGARIILKAHTNGRAEIAFINASTVERCVEVLDAFLHTTAKTGVEWRPDKYYKEPHQ